jgi:hypothetical protein
MTKFTPHILIMALGGAALALGGCKSSKPADQTLANEPTAASTDWTAQNPTEAAVPVELPKTVMTNVPPEQAKPSPSASPPAK